MRIIFWQKQQQFVVVLFCFPFRIFVVYSCFLLLILSDHQQHYGTYAWNCNSLTTAVVSAMKQKQLLLSRTEFLSTIIASSSSIVLDNNDSKSSGITSTNNDNDNTNTSFELCRNGALIPEVAVPGAYNQVCMNLNERILENVIPAGYNNNNNGGDGTSIRIRQEASGSGKTGLAVWNSGLLLSRLLIAFVTSPTTTITTTTNNIDWWKKQRILELGCGTGLVSIVSSMLGAQSVIATDGNPDVIKLTETNIKLNNVQNIVSTSVLSWGILNAIDYVDEADIIIGSDLTYNSGSWRVLAETMSTIVSDNGYIIYLSLGHDGFNVNAEIDGFLSVAKEQGLIECTTINGISITNLLNQIITPMERKQVLPYGARVIILTKK